MIIDKEKLIFVHIPKNAGSAIKSLFFEKDELETPFKHKTINEIKKENPKEYNSYRKFAIVRNPYDRMISWYAYQKRYRLDMCVTMRSNDLWYGFCNDQYQFSKLQHYVWNRLGKDIEIGTYFHFAHNLHLYNDKL